MKNLLLLLLAFTSTVLFAQEKFTTLEGKSLRRVEGKLGNKVFFNIGNNSLWETDGTNAGTKKISNSMPSTLIVKPLQWSQDSLVFVNHFGEVYLYTESLEEPEFIVGANGLDLGGVLERYGDQLVFFNKDVISFVDLKTKEIFNLPLGFELSTLEKMKWIYKNGKIICLSDDFGQSDKLIVVDVLAHTIVVEYEDNFKDICLIDEGVMVFTEQNIWKLDLTTNELDFLSDFGQNAGNNGFCAFPDSSGKVFFYYANGQNAILAVTDGTPLGTFPLVKFPKKWIYIILTCYRSPIFYGDNLYFIGEGGLWKSDGTVAGTKLVEPNISYLYQQKLKGKHLVRYFEKGKSENLAIFNGDTIIPLKSYAERNYRLGDITFSSPFEVNNKLYLLGYDLDFGLEIHRFNYDTKELTIVKDFVSGTGWFEQSGFIGQADNRFVFYNQSGSALNLYSLMDSSILVSPEPEIKENVWEEDLVSSNRLTVSSSSVNEVGDVIYAVSLKERLSQYSTSFFECVQNQKRERVAKNVILKFNIEGHLKLLKKMPTKGEKFACKYDANGDYILAFVIDKSSNFDGFDLTVANGSLVIMKYNAQDEVLWLKQASIGQYGGVESMEIGNNNDIIILGKFSGNQAKFDDIVIDSKRNPTTFCVKYDKKGKVLWANGYPLSYRWPADYGAIKSSLGTNGELYFYQRLVDDLEIDSCSNGAHYFYVNAVAPDGNYLWGREFEGDDFLDVSGIDVAKNGNLFLVGGYNDRIQFDHVELVSDTCYKSNTFLLELNKQGKVVAAKELFEDANQLISDIKFDSEGNYFVTGHTRINEYFGKNMGADTSYADFSYHLRGFLFKYNSGGEIINKRFIDQNSNYFDVYWSFRLDPVIDFMPDGDLLLSLGHQQYLDTFNVTGVFSTENRIFIQKFHFQEEDASDADSRIPSSSVYLSPNPTADYLYISSSDIDFADAKIIIYAVDGKAWSLPIKGNNGTALVDVRGLPKGTYTAVIYIGDVVLSEKFVKL